MTRLYLPSSLFRFSTSITMSRSSAVTATWIAVGGGVLTWTKMRRILGKSDKAKRADAARAAPIQGACVRFSLADMVSATSHWAPQLLVGDGYRLMFRGVDPRDAATPWLLKRCRAREFDEFHAEVAEMGNKNHPNLLRLLGYCDEQDKQGRWEKVVVYEFMPAGTLLDQFQPGTSTPLTLQQRVDILIGVARALEYLHSFGIVHRDIKPANILLDAHMQAKVSDFGLLRMGEGSGSLQSTRVMGTPGYVDPVYSLTHKATPSADVYSFGVVMMELLTCKHVVLPCEDGSHINIKDWVEQEVERGGSASVVNGDLKAPLAVASNLVTISLSCVAKLGADG
ncbi:unnamed protein product [Closterium sp. Yama58-4]|nr:unnamed protein product [Closterium sp. Yama58-4]